MALPDLMTCFAATAPGLEEVLAGELHARGLVVGAIEPGGAEFTANALQLADALLQLRTANRITVRLASFHARTFGELERHAARIPWADVLAPGRAIHFRVTSKKSRLYHQEAVAERLERAALAEIAGATAVRGASDAEALESDVKQLPAVQRIIVRIMRDEVTISADAAGALLHLRGWREAVGKAPLRETLAAGLLLAGAWDPGLALTDPFCGSGTIPIEAALLARRIAPGRGRRFAMETWTGLPRDVMRTARERAVAEERSAAAPIAGHDRDAGAIAAAMANAERAGVASDIRFERQAISDLSSDAGEGWIVTNPPYGARIGERAALRDLYAVLGRVLRDRRPRWRLVMFSADRMLERQTKVALEDVLRTSNGGIPVRMVTNKS